MDWKEVIETLRAKFHQVRLPKSFLAINLSESHTFHRREEEKSEGEGEGREGGETSSLCVDLEGERGRSEGTGGEVKAETKGKSKGKEKGDGEESASGPEKANVLL
jgi:hypothetical protein